MVQPWVACLGVAGVTIFAICTIAYIIVETNKTKKLTYKSNSSARTHEIYSYDPETKSVTESAAPVTNDSNNNLRKRHVSKSPPSNPKKNESEKSNDEKKCLSVSTGVQTDFIDRTDPIDVNWNVKEKKVYLDKSFTPRSVEEKVVDYIRNIPEINNEESDSDTLSHSSTSNWSNLSSEKPTDNSERAYKKKIHRSFKKYVNSTIEAYCESQSESAENSDSLSSTTSVSSSSSWSNISSEKSTDDFEKKYKKRMHKSLKKFVTNMNLEAASECPSVESDGSFSILEEEPNNCIACEENPINTHAQPCNHRFLCSDCAMKFFKLCKKCKICRSKIEKVVVED